MKNIAEELPEDPDQSAIINKDAEFENSAVDPGFVSGEKQEDSDDAVNQRQDDQSADMQDEQGTERGAGGLGELDGTNPGSNHHPMDS
ncbi:hypothetical protein ABDJ41_20375 [Pedobacter sp. ASV1-7]|uniref:hypothetical protein n=1 Tax=Pedobacter sp. ASV1-7 TaxID=3145237 RepID=UPI0032E8C4E3